MKNYSKRDIINDICRRTKIDKKHIYGVVNFLIEEMLMAFDREEDVELPNFGTFTIKTLAPKKICSLVYKEVKYTKPSKSLRFKLDSTIMDLLIKKDKNNE